MPDDGISQVPGEPPLHLRRALRPRQDHGRLTGCATPWRGPRGGNVKGSCIAAFEAQSPGFGARCLRFAPAVARPGRKTRFRLLVRLCRTGFDPQGSDERFQSVSLHLVLLSQASLGAIPNSGQRSGVARRS